MASQTYLKVALKLMALYAGLMGALALLFHDAAAFLFQYSLEDPLITRYWGGALLVISIFYLFLSMDPVKYRMFIWVGVFDLSISLVLTVFNMYTYAISWIQGLISVVINPILIVVLLYGLAKEPEGEVVLVVGEEKKAKPEQELPAHITGHHPLDRK